MSEPEHDYNDPAVENPRRLRVYNSAINELHRLLKQSNSSKCYRRINLTIDKLQAIISCRGYELMPEGNE